MYEPFNKDTASTQDRIAWTLCQIIDDNAPLQWTRYRGVGTCIASNHELMADLAALEQEGLQAAKRDAKRQARAKK